MQHVEIYTDGACKGNPGVGGWGVVIKRPERDPIYYNGYESKTTNNKMELLAAIMALEVLKVPSHIILYSDSEYVINGITKWIKTWQKNNWRSSTGRTVKNQILWMRLLRAVKKHLSVEWRWVKGHNGNPDNERADQLANEAITSNRSTYSGHVGFSTSRQIYITS